MQPTWGIQSVLTLVPPSQPVKSSPGICLDERLDRYGQGVLRMLNLVPHINDWVFDNWVFSYSKTKHPTQYTLVYRNRLSNATFYIHGVSMNAGGWPSGYSNLELRTLKHAV